MSGPINDAKSGQTKDAQDPAGTCPLKQSMLGIIPVRYAFDDNDENGQQLHPLPADGKQWQGQLKSKSRHYTLRQLRDGWLYVYDETAQTFHEYQVTGSQLTKIDWSSDEAMKPADERGSKGESKSCLFYPATHTLFIGYAHQRWTWRVCEHMRSHSGSRNKIMRKLSLKQLEKSGSLPHVQFASYLGDHVADIDLDASTKQDLFADTCTPLSQQESDSNTDSLFKWVAPKPAAASSEYLKDLPEQNCGVFVALDDPFADTADLFIQFAEQIGNRANLIGDEEKQHKLHMAQLSRTLGRVTLEDQELPEYVKQDPIRILEFEKALTEYVFTAQLADIEFDELASNKLAFSSDLSPMRQQADQQLAELERMYSFRPSSKQVRQWQEKNNIFHDEVRWNDLDNFLIQHYTELKGLDEQIQVHYARFMSALNHLGTDPVLLGIDNQDEYQQAYLIELVSQFLVVVVQANQDEKDLEKLKKELSLDSPKNLMALASVGFSLEANRAINSHVKDFNNSLLSTSSPSDMVALSSAIGNWETFTGDSRIQEKAWFKSLIEPVQMSFVALQKAVANLAKDSWEALFELLFPIQYQSKGHSPSLVANLRLLLVQRIIHETTVLKHNPDYAKEMRRFHHKVELALKEISEAVNLKPGQRSPKNHQIGSATAARQKLAILLGSEMPMMIEFQDRAVMKAFRQSVNEKIQAIWNKTRVTSVSVSEALGGMGGFVLVLNMWNTMAVLGDLQYKLAENPSLNPMDNPAVGEAWYATGYTVVAAGAMSAGKAWSSIAKKDLLDQSLKVVIKNHPNVAIRSALNTFTNSISVVSAVGIIASALETWESLGRFRDATRAPLERFGYVLKGAATLSQTIIFVAQFTSLALSRQFGLVSIGAISAGWMLTGLAIIGVIYLIAVIITNVFKRSDLEKWLRQSIWGVDNQRWTSTQELINLELLIHRPVIRLKGVIAEKPSYHAYQFDKQWQLELELPLYLERQTIGLQITRLPKPQTYSYQVPVSNSPVLINEQSGQWSIEKEKLVYRLNLGGRDSDMVGVCIAMPFNWIDQDDKLIKFCAKGMSHGELKLQPIQDNDFATRIVKVEINK
ncbi:hypothetical protein LA983_004074 [Vibrio fluvialis]|nr:hypothetical protein [Vibrio fluvialis]